MLALTSMARKLSCTLQAANIYCSSRRRSSLTALPTFDLPAIRSEDTTSNPSHQPKEFGYEASSPLASVDLNPKSQCYLASNRWLSMNGAFFAERIPLELLGRGLVGEVWYEQARNAEGSIVPLITKLYDYQLPAGTLGLYVELFLYVSWDHLRPLQGQCTPNVIGPFSSPGGKIALLMEPISPSGWREASMSDSDEIKEKVIAAYAMVHSRGVLHNDVELRHILISNEGSVQIIDWQMAKSIRPNEDVGLNACTQADLDYEARKVKAILNYQGAYARELALAAPLYEMCARGYLVDKTDPRLGWFPPNELDLMINGDWTEPDVEYSGGRATMAPLLRSHPSVGPSRANTPCRPKCYNKNSHTSKAEESLDPTTTTTNIGYWTMGDATSSHTCDTRQPTAQLPATVVSGEGPVRGEEEEEEYDSEGEDHRPFLGRSRNALWHLWGSFGFYNYGDTARQSWQEELAPLGDRQGVTLPKSRQGQPLSGLLLPKFGPSRPSFALPPEFNPQAAERPKQRQPPTLRRHTQWRLTAYAKLAKSRLNPTGSRPDLPSRRNVTLLGSEDFVRLDLSYLPPRTLRPFGAIVLGSTPEQCTIAPPPRTFSEATLQAMFPPPPLRKRRLPKRRADGTLFEEQLARWSDSKYMLRAWGGDLDKVIAMILRTDTGVRPVSPELVADWENDLAPLRAFITNCSNLAERKSDIRPANTRARLDHVLSVMPKLKEIEEMIRERSSPAPKQANSPPDNQGDPPLDDTETTLGSPQSPSHPLSAHPSSGDEVALPVRPPTACSEQSRATQATDRAPSPPTPSATSEPGTPKPELSLDAADATIAAPTSPVLSPPPAASEVPPSLKPRRRSAPYPEPSSRRLRSADSLAESSSTPNVNTQPAAPKAKRRASRGQGSSPAIQASTTPAPTVTSQSFYHLRSRKRAADVQPAGPSKRRRSS
ncbi:hypothetical protein FRC08_018954 [Ceratobasidium sp. 394]|nr:hypothetical protein FRC08_018954 [Ceratobasidium sp. 394]